MPGSLLKMDLKLDNEIKGSFLYRLSRSIQYKIKIFLEKKAFKSCQKIITFSEASKKLIITTYNISPEKISVVPMGIDINEINGIPEEKQTIFSVSRLTKSKNLEMAVETMKRLRGFRWFIAGEGQEREFLEKRIKELGLGNKIFLLGQIDNVADYYRKCDVFVHLSYYENFGQVLLEAMLYGKPPIVLDPKLPDVHTASDEIIQDGYNGFFVDNNPDAIADKIREVSISDKRILSENCRQYVRKYSFSNHLRELFRLIEENLEFSQKHPSDVRKGERIEEICSLCSRN
jgi:glycosyltransferase involved in cell wall biosynthesis